ncbi:MAG TPA: cytochrome c3 family protein [Syntrophales bacterium]|nr:cytochrome c3 family protein [Syntrophales bacterium]
MRKRMLILCTALIITVPLSGAGAADKPPAGILYTQPLKSVLFSHGDHLQKGTSCSTCHSGLFDMEALRAQTRKDFNMAALYKGKYCGACHNGRKAFAADTQCARCHLGTRGRVAAEDAPVYKATVRLGRGGQRVAFSHESHRKKATCRTCHPGLFQPKEGAARIGMADHDRNKFCFGCHSGKVRGVFAWSDCSRCHGKAVPAPKEAIRFGKENRIVTFRHDTHQPKAGCQACHPGLFAFRKGTARIGFPDHMGGKFCFTCHAQKGGAAFYTCNGCHK